MLIRIVLCTSKKHCGQWLILERGYDAQDNAWHFFKYLINEHPELNVKFAIKKESPDYQTNLKEYKDHVILYNSLNYYKFLFSSELLCSTHLNTFTPILKVTTILQKSKFGYKGKTIFLQHGITRQDIEGLKYPHQNPDLFISGAQNEYKLLNDRFNYPKGRIVYTGFARYDNLLNTDIRRQILIMPTWRAWCAEMNIETFKQSDFYKEYSKLISDKNLLSALEKYDYRIVFYNHFEFQKFNCVFEAFSNPRVKIMQFGKKRVQELLKESALLVTDYSSIYYDFLYMKKPIIFFTFDKERFDSNHYGKNYDDPNNFGDVEHSSEMITKTLVKYIENGCKISENHRNFAGIVFKYNDTNNCQRIYNAIKNIL